MFEEIRPVAISMASRIFERMFFLPVEIPGESGNGEHLPITSPILYRGEIGFFGKNTGQMRLYLPCDLADIMVQNLMGLDEWEMSESNKIDMVNELCNVLCGNLFFQLDRKSVWDLTLPCTDLVPPQEAECETNHESAIDIRLVAEGFGVKLIIEFKN